MGENSKKICIIMERFPDLEAPTLLEQVEIMEKMGYYLRIISICRPSENDLALFPERLKSKVHYLDNPVKAFPKAFFTMLMFFLISPVRSVRTLGAFLHLHKNPFRSLRLIKNYMHAMLLVNQHIIDRGIDHIHSHCSPDAAITSYLTSSLSGMPLSYTALPGEIFIKKFRGLKPALCASQYIFTLSNYDRKAIYEMMLTNIKNKPALLSIFNGIDLQLFDFIKDFTLPEPPYHFITVATLTRKKGIDTILRAMQRLKEEGIEFSYNVVGEGPARKPLEAMAADLGLSDNVSFPGIIPRYEIPKLLEAADLFLLAPRILENGERDSIPTCMKEAMAIGLPTVCTDCGAVSELVENLETGLLAPPDQPEAFAEACKTLLHDSDLRIQILLKARLRIEGSYDIAKQAQWFSKFVSSHSMSF
ncbi:glycosyltransferase family 4 protein [Lentisphaerota bacterium ZTH]|nr:glycosyltransferase family 4 protein [Lentisphaerota bacterium]WET05208.1 glycosyltransferase family 4 protein [Lentisphaerota bacterium ZTH]